MPQSSVAGLWAGNSGLVNLLAGGAFNSEELSDFLTYEMKISKKSQWNEIEVYYMALKKNPLATERKDNPHFKGWLKAWLGWLWWFKTM